MYNAAPAKHVTIPFLLVTWLLMDFLWFLLNKELGGIPLRMAKSSGML